MELITSPFLLAELEDILVRFGVSEIERRDYFDLLLRVAKVVEPKEIPKIIESDPDDDHLLAAALEGGANLIVTGDKKVLALGEYLGIPIVRTRRALDLL